MHCIHSTTAIIALMILTSPDAGTARNALAPPTAVKAPKPITVMVLGTYHFGNPGRDIHNAHVDPVTTRTKQRELADLARRLARFGPTMIAVEQTSDAADLADPGYASFTAGDLTSKSDEVVQIGYRTPP